MDLFLKDRIAIVGGASQGIGYGIARTLGGEGARLAIMARRVTDLERAAEEIRRETGAQVLAVAADCRRAEDCSRAIEEVTRAYGGIDILVNNDGAPPLGEIASFDDAAWQRAVEQNLMYVVRMARGALPCMKARRGGSILNITAISAIQPIAGFGLSVATWSGVIGFAKTRGKDPDVMRNELRAEVPLGRIGTVDDIAGLAALLVSPRGSYITGAAIQVDGGLLRAVR